MVLPTRPAILNNRLSREEAVFLRPLLNEISSPVLLFNKYTREILDVNELFIANFGYDRSQLIGSPIDLIISFVEETQIESERAYPSEDQATLVTRNGRKAPVNLKHIHIESNLYHIAALIITGPQHGNHPPSLTLSNSPFKISAQSIETINTQFDSFDFTGIHQEIFNNILQTDTFVIFEEIPGEDDLITVMNKGFDRSIVDFLKSELSNQRFKLLIIDKLPLAKDSTPEGHVAALRQRGQQKTIIIVTHIPFSVSLKEVKDRLVLLSTFHRFISKIAEYEEKSIAKDNSQTASLFTDEMSTPIQDVIQDGIISVSPDKKVQDMNTAAEKILGYTENEARNLPIENIMIGSDLITSALNLASSGKDTDDLGTVDLHRRDGELFPAQVKTYPVPQSDGKFSILVFLKDLTEYESTREKMEHLERRAMMGNLSSVFAHEVRNPVNNISMGLQNLAEDATDENSKKHINELRDECDRITRLMDATLMYTKAQEYNYDVINLQTLFQFFIQRNRHKFVKFNVKPNLKIHQETPKISGDRLSLERVFTNITNNALNAMEDLGGGILAINIYPVEISTGKPGVQIDFSDNGPGIPKENIDKIFEPFFTTNPKGTGLGLAISRQTITAHKGSIQVDSFPGGTVFKIILPALSNQNPEEENDS